MGDLLEVRLFLRCALAKPHEPVFDDHREAVQCGGVESGKGKVERIGFDREFGQTLRAKITQCALTTFTNSVELALGIIALLLDPVFHEQFLSYGSAPVKYIRELMLRK